MGEDRLLDAFVALKEGNSSNRVSVVVFFGILSIQNGG